MVNKKQKACAVFHPQNPLRGIAEDVVTPTVSWCAENIYLSPRIPTARPGQWREANVAALCIPGGPLDALDDPAVETVVVCKGSQTALTTTAYCWLAKCLAHDPGSALIVMNSTQDARDKSSETWRPMWEDSPALKRFLPADRRREWTKLYQLINRSPVYWIGANSAGRLGAKPIRRLILDEVDKYPDKFGGAKERREAGAAALAEQRTKTFKQAGLSKIVKFSTPTNDRGEIWTSYLQGDQRKLYVRCHKCKAEQVMVWSNWQIDLDRASSDPGAVVAAAHYACPHCSAKWTDEQRWTAIDKGVWRATVEAKDPRCRSFLLPSWCSKMVTTEYLAAERIKAITSPNGLHGFINGECGEAYFHYENMVKASVFTELEGDYQDGEMFADAPVYAAQYAGMERAVLAGVDVQKGYLVAVFRQFVDGGDSGLVWAGVVANFHELHTLVERFGALFIFMDQRYRTWEVHEWCASNPGAGYIPCIGIGRRARSIFTENIIDLSSGRKGVNQAGNIITGLDHEPDQVKDVLAACIQGAKGARRWLVPRGTSLRADYCDQMSAERCVNGRWMNPRNSANHFWDAEVLAMLGAIYVKTSAGLPLFRGGVNATANTEKGA